MGCQKHAFRERDCLACEVKELKAQNKAQSQAQARVNRQARQLEAQEAYQAELDADLARFEMQLEMEAAERARAEQARYRRAMWEQTPDGQAWAELSQRGEQWMVHAQAHDDALLEQWQRAVEPRWFTDEFEEARRAADRALSAPESALKAALLVGSALYVVNRGSENPVLTALMWAAFLVVPVCAILRLRAGRTYGRAAIPLEDRKRNSDEVKAFVERYGANPFTEPEKLPSWREGLTRGQNAAQIQAVKGWVYLDLNKFPAASSLPTLPPIVARSDLSDWPEPVAQALRARLTQN